MEKVLLLCTERKKQGIDGICGVFQPHDGFISLSTQEYIKFSSAYIASCMDYCVQHQKGFAMIHNHKAGNCFSRSDLQTEAQLHAEAEKRQVLSFHFMVLDMSNATVRAHSYTNVEHESFYLEWELCLEG